MSDVPLGGLRNKDFARQLRDFTGLTFGKISPTDIDAFLDFGGKLFVFIEGKHGTAMPPFGQKLALERIVNACQAGGVETLLLLASHDTKGDVDYASLPVTRLFHKGKWRPPHKAITVRQAIDEFRAWFDRKG